MEESFLATEQHRSLYSSSAQNIQLCVPTRSQWPFWTKKPHLWKPPLKSQCDLNWLLKLCTTSAPTWLFFYFFGGLKSTLGGLLDCAFNLRILSTWFLCWIFAVGRYYFSEKNLFFVLIFSTTFSPFFVLDITNLL
jgi:hypothetical protein